MSIMPKTVKTGRRYTTEEILEVLTEKSELPTPYLNKGLIGSGVCIPGESGGVLTATYDVMLTSGKKGITVSQVIGGSSKGSVIKNFAKDTIVPTSGLVSMARNKELFDLTVEEVTRLFVDGQ